VKNKLSDLRNHLFVALENLSDATPETIDLAVKKAEAVSSVAKVIVDSARVEVEFLARAGSEVQDSVFSATPALPHARGS